MTIKEQNKIVLITGGNRGIGFETANQLGAKGFTILIGARNKERGKDAEIKLQTKGIDAHFIEIDVKSQSSIGFAAKKIETIYGKLDILVNNVGVVMEKFDRVSASELDIKILRETFDTNFFSMFAVTKSMLPLIRKSMAGRIVNMSSGLGSLTQQSDPNLKMLKLLAYNSSKSAINQLTIHFAYELKNSGIKVNSADPGATATGFNNFMSTGSAEQASNIGPVVRNKVLIL